MADSALDGLDDLDERKQRILRAIVAEYVTSGEPVGSSRVVATAGLDCSAATVRNEMAVLEERGLVMAPHTSAGRVPTDLGYRAFVEMLRDSTDPTDLQAQQRELIDQLLSGASDVDDLLARTTTVLSQLTRLVSLVIAPAFDQARLKLVELVALSPHAVMLLLVADTGSVTKRVLDLTEAVTDTQVDRVRAGLQDQLQGRRMGDLGEVVTAMVANTPPELRQLVAAVAAVATRTVSDEAVHRMYVSGRASLASTAFERDDLSRVLALLEEEATLARVLGDSTGGDSDLPVVRIGTEHDLDDLASTSLVAQRYQLAQAGALGVLGPTRMDYASVLASVRAVADHLESTLAVLAD